MWDSLFQPQEKLQKAIKQKTQHLGWVLKSR